jgi:Polyketide cyclase / dehydrase and lipid transport
MLLRILLALAVLVVVAAVVIALQPSHFRIARTLTMRAPAPVVFAQVNDFHNWRAWSPFAQVDPAMQESYAGAAAGMGAVYTWSGDKRAGEGRMTLTDSLSPERIRIRLEFVRPMTATNTAEFTFQPQGDGTAVTWSMEGDRNFLFKAVGLFMNMDKIVGGEFEKGLQQMKSIVEAAHRR